MSHDVCCVLTDSAESLMKTTLFCGLLIGLWASFATHGYAQDDRAQVMGVVDSLFDGMRAKDEGVLRSLFAPGASVGDSDADSFVASVLSATVHLDEVTFDETVRVDDNLAMAWTPYNIFIDNQFHHCGVDLFVMKRIEGVWLITDLEDTRRTDGCETDRRE